MANYVVTSKVKEYLKSKGMRTSADAIDALDKRVAQILDAAAERTRGNKRATVKGADV